MRFIIPDLGNIHDELLFMIVVGVACIFTVFTIIYGGIEEND